MKTAMLMMLALAGLATTAHPQTVANPHGPNVGACALCHRADSWRPARISRDFRHAEKAFPLDGAHLRTGCTSCHTSLDFSKAPTNCAQCHQDVHKAELGGDCARCHTTRSFVDQTNLKRMHELTRFPLRGAHAPLACEACHTSAQPGQSQYVRRPTTCISCHVASYREARSPDHQAAQFSQDCSTCHTMSSWIGGRFDHSTTKFALAGAHAAVACQGCHSDGVFRGKTTTCVGCHQADYTWTKTPPHAASGFPTDCLTCHTVARWLGATFDHDKSGFPLTGAHRAALCSGCHADNVYKGKPTLCQSCHQRNYDASTHPPHSQTGFSTTCASCHGTSTWLGASFDHSTTKFPLTGAHRTATCNNCHADNVYRGKPSACVACHQQNYTATTTPPHAASGFPTTCAQCHGTSTWLGSGFDHSATAFPLAGAHLTAACTSCHGDGVYKGKSTACQSCHQPAYTASAHPPHALLGFSTTCSNCHTMTAWAGGTFDHGTTRFALAGAHRAVSCNGCHGDGVYRGKSMLCASCHLARYTAATTPPHASSGFPTTCEVCHGTTAWTPATFNHQTTRFPLTGAHGPLACAACHGDGVYRGKPMACVSCHQATYNATTNPNHKAANFPTLCESCHTTTKWLGATFNHDGSFFPIYSGVHKGRWSTCADCHTVSTNYASFSCFSCHQQSKMDSAHRGRTGYRYDSVLCYQCHPQGKKP